jgi:Dolichyl-phosphate-mannose-protein mannosyltransferase
VSGAVADLQAARPDPALRTEGAVTASRSRRAAWLLVLASLLVYNANLREISSADTIATRLLPVALVREQRLTLDRYFRDDPALPYWVQRVGEHYVSSYPIAPGVLAVPVYLLPILALGDGSWALINGLAKLSASLMAALSVLFVYLVARRLAVEPVAVAIALVYAFGTATWSVSSQGLWGHAPAQLFMAVAVYCLLRGADDRRYLLYAGLAAGVMVASRPTTAVVAAALLAYGLVHDGRRGVPIGLGFLAIALPVALHNLWQFGSLQGGYAKLHATHATYHGVASAWAGSIVQGLAGVLVSPSRGLLVYSPVLLFAGAGAVLAFGSRGVPLLRWLAGAAGATVLMLGGFSVWWGGHSFGPRLLADVLPLLALLLLPVWPRLRGSRSLRVAFGVLLAVSVAVQVVGAFYHPSPRAVDWNTSPRDVDEAHDRLWDWTDPQILRLLRNGPHALGFE